jgi:hypothetical protein
MFSVEGLGDRMNGKTSGEFEKVLCYLDWMDCPRFGVALVNGVAHYFESTFDEALDDYATDFELWPIDQRLLARELESYHDFAQWRAKFDRGEKVERYVVNVDENLLLNGARAERVDRFFARPVWRFDPDRSYSVKVPEHFVSWHRSS